MVMLGDLIGTGGAGVVLPADLSEAVDALSDNPDAFMRQAVLRFEREAPPEEWATVMSRLVGASDPGAACLEHIMRWNLRATFELRHKGVKR